METKKLSELNSFNISDHEAEQVFREICSWYNSKYSDQLSSQAYQKYINNYHKAKSLYLITKGTKNRTQLIIYDTESEKEEIKTLKKKIPLDYKVPLTLLPNGELFLFYKSRDQIKALIINCNYDVRILPYDLHLINSSAIYFNGNIYCFGGESKFSYWTSFSWKFDLKRYRWINLTPIPKADRFCYSVIFNGDILICGSNENLLLYSVDIDSFSTIPYKFLYRSRKFLINAERLYLIECFGFIYESENDNEFIWNKISETIARPNWPRQMYCVYNKGEIYISVESTEERYFKFDIKQRKMDKF